MTKRDVIARIKAGFRIDGDPDSEMPCALIDPNQRAFDSQTLVPIEMLRELLEDGIIKPNAGSGRRVFASV